MAGWADRGEGRPAEGEEAAAAAIDVEAFDSVEELEQLGAHPPGRCPRVLPWLHGIGSFDMHLALTRLQASEMNVLWALCRQ